MDLIKDMQITDYLPICFATFELHSSLICELCNYIPPVLLLIYNTAMYLSAFSRNFYLYLTDDFLCSPSF